MPPRRYARHRSDASALATVEGTHARGGGGEPVGYHVDYEVVGSAIHFRATFEQRRRA